MLLALIFVIFYTSIHESGAQLTFKGSDTVKELIGQLYLNCSLQRTVLFQYAIKEMTIHNGKKILATLNEGSEVETISDKKWLVKATGKIDNINGLSYMNVVIENLTAKPKHSYTCNVTAISPKGQPVHLASSRLQVKVTPPLPREMRAYMATQLRFFQHRFQSLDLTITAVSNDQIKITHDQKTIQNFQASVAEALKNDQAKMLQEIKSAVIDKNVFDHLRSIKASKADVDKLKLSLTNQNDAHFSEIAEDVASLKSSRVSKAEIETLKSVLVAKKDMDSLKSAKALKSELKDLSLKMVKKKELIDLGSTKAEKTELNTLRLTFIDKDELENLRSTNIEQKELDSMRNITVDKKYLTSLKLIMAEKKDLDQIKSAIAETKDFNLLKSNMAEKTDLKNMILNMASKTELDHLIVATANRSVVDDWKLELVPKVELETLKSTIADRNELNRIKSTLVPREELENIKIACNKVLASNNAVVNFDRARAIEDLDHILALRTRTHPIIVQWTYDKEQREELRRKMTALAEELPKLTAKYGGTSPVDSGMFRCDTSFNRVNSQGSRYKEIKIKFKAAFLRPPKIALGMKTASTKMGKVRIFINYTDVTADGFVGICSTFGDVTYFTSFCEWFAFL